MMKKLTSPLIAAAIVLAGSFLWNANAPVVFGMNAKFVEAASGAATAKVSGWKIRDCLVVEGSFVGWYKSQGVWHETEFSFPNDTSPDSSKPMGFARINFGLFRWDGLPESANKVRLTNQHFCGGKVFTTVSGPWELPKPPPSESFSLINKFIDQAFDLSA